MRLFAQPPVAFFLLLPLTFDPIVGTEFSKDSSNRSASFKDMLFSFVLLLLFLLDSAGDKSIAKEVPITLVKLLLFLFWPFLLLLILFESSVGDGEIVDMFPLLLEALLRLLPFRNIDFVILSPG